LMISKLALVNLKFSSYGFKENKERYSLIGLSILSIILLGWLSVPVIFLLYILVSLLFKNKLK
jgi:CDP-diacylglycerol--serine O-phosphatidyltransferase